MEEGGQWQWVQDRHRHTQTQPRGATTAAVPHSSEETPQPCPGKHLLLLPEHTPGPLCSKLLQPELKLHSAAAPGLPAGSEGSTMGPVQIVHSCPDPFKLLTPTQPLQLPPTQPD